MGTFNSYMRGSVTVLGSQYPDAAVVDVRRLRRLILFEPLSVVFSFHQALFHASEPPKTHGPNGEAQEEYLPIPRYVLRCAGIAHIPRHLLTCECSC